ncbi:MAG: hypothetical protein WC947_04500 [Elusimicrobiota bacterium]
MTTLQQITESIKEMQKVIPKRKNFAARYLGKFTGIIQNGISSTAYIRKMRETLYGKIK